MAPKSEGEIISMIDEALSALEDQAAKDRVLTWACGKFSSQKAQTPHLSPTGPVSAKTREPKQPRKSEDKAKTASHMAIVKELDLRPAGKTPFHSFATTKSPKSNHEKNAVAVYYLQKELDIPHVTPGHVYTCYKDVHWRVPAELYGSLTLTANRKGWIDTRDMENIRVTPHGENLIEHDLPRQKKAKE